MMMMMMMVRSERDSSSELRDGARGQADSDWGLEVAVKAHSVILDHACMFIDNV